MQTEVRVGGRNFFKKIKLGWMVRTVTEWGYRHWERNKMDDGKWQGVKEWDLTQNTRWAIHELKHSIPKNLQQEVIVIIIRDRISLCSPGWHPECWDYRHIP
jgi:hypothetical protein